MELTVELRLLTAAEGGRKTAIGSDPYQVGSFRPNWLFPHTAEMQYGAAVTSLDRSPLQPGETTRAVISPMFPHFWTEIAVGDELQMMEGHRKCGIAIVKKIQL